MAFYVRLDVITFICCVFVAVHCFKTGLGGDSNNNLYVKTCDHKHGLNKRAVNKAAKGLAAAQKLLSDAHHVNVQSKTFRKYYKTGDTNTALKDFHSVSPVNVQRKSRFNFGRGGVGDSSIVGHVGDRRLILRPSGDKYSNRYPVLEIRTPTDPVYDRIIYKTPDMK